ncbi:3827_t:CDS:2, partial [Entrophospora sp. SA101]
MSSIDNNHNDNDDVVYSCFFYGTLMSPRIFERVINKSTTTTITESSNSNIINKNFNANSAILKGYKRVRVRYATYPAIFKTNDDDDEQYNRKNVNVYLKKIETIATSEETERMVSAQSYVWSDSLDFLEIDKEWNPLDFGISLNNWTKKDFDE